METARNILFARENLEWDNLNLKSVQNDRLVAAG